MYCTGSGGVIEAEQVQCSAVPHRKVRSYSREEAVYWYSSQILCSVMPRCGVVR
jgi:hypothetical protein